MMPDHQRDDSNRSKSKDTESMLGWNLSLHYKQFAERRKSTLGIQIPQRVGSCNIEYRIRSSGRHLEGNDTK